MQTKISRRDFLKTAAGASALLMTGAGLGGVFRSAAAAPTPEEDEWVYSYCRNCIAPWCGIKIRKRNGVAIGLEGDPEWPINRGRLCPRGNTSIDGLYNPYRVKAPLKRTNPVKAIDNDPGWVEISWEEAIATCVDKLSAVRADNPNKLVVARGFGAIWDDMPMFRPLFGAAFPTATATEVNGPLCPFHYGPLVVNGSFTCAADLMRCNYLVTFGANYGGDFVRANAGADCLYTSTALLNEALERGMKLFSFDPHAGGDQKSSGVWIPIKPGTDLPVVLAMAEVIMCEMDTRDDEFVRFRSNFPYLIKADETYCRDAETNKPLIWDEALGRALPFDSPELSAPALTGVYTVNGAETRPAFSIIKDKVSEFTPEVAESISGVPAGTIREVTAGLVQAAMIGSTIELDGFTFPYRPACVHYGRGTTAHRGGVYFMFAVNIVNTLLGALDVPGGVVGGSGFGDFLSPNEDGTVLPHKFKADEWVDDEFNYPVQSFDLGEFYPHRHSTPHVVWRAMLDPQKYYIDFEPEILWIWGANPFMNNIVRDEVEEAFRKVWVLDIAYNFDETSQFADLLLAESSNLERVGFTTMVALDLDGKHRGCTGVNFRAPVVDLVYNTRTGASVIADIANAMGMTAQMNGMFTAMAAFPPGSVTPAGPQPHTFEEMSEMLLKALYGQDKSLDDIMKNGSYFTAQPWLDRDTYNYYYFPGRSTRVAVWEDHLHQSGLRIKGECEKHGITVPGWELEKYLAFYKPYPVWIPHPEHEAPPEYDLFAVNWKVAGRSMAIGGVTQSGVLREVQAFTDPNIDTIIINAATARARGLSEGDTVLVESQFGKSLTGQLHLTELIEPSCLGFAGNYGHAAPLMGKYARRGLSYNQLLSAKDGNFDPVSGGMDNTAACKISRLK
ncbi:MAG: molybdopterin-dependent oxidoreductase [Gracilibacteraceae bacterium]|nr:molybdopterin-dependent oxidoreductase [Gracilibacteraceae bacterium]